MALRRRRRWGGGCGERSRAVLLAAGPDHHGRQTGTGQAQASHKKVLAAQAESKRKHIGPVDVAFWPPLPVRSVCVWLAAGLNWACCCNTICNMKSPGDTLTQSVFVTGLAGGQPVGGRRRPSGRPCLWALHACGRAASCACLGRAAAMQPAGARTDW